MKKTVIVGGDERFVYLYKKLKEKGLRVESLGLFDGDNADLKKADAVILPLPATRDKIHIEAPLTKREIFIRNLENEIPKSAVILSGGNPFKERTVTDYLKSDEYALLNAVPTAEGAIAYAIQNTRKTLFGGNVLVIGYGRVGKILAHRLYALGARVTVAARNPFDKGLIKALGYNFTQTEFLNKSDMDFDIIFNTVDVATLKSDTLKRCGAELIADLSTTHPIESDFANENGIKAVSLPSLPAKTAPTTAAENLFNTIYNLLPFKGE